jgi:hypothetical protein
VKTINTPHHCQQILHRANLLSHFLRHVISGYTLFSQMLEFKGGPSRVACHEISEIVPFYALQHRKKLAAVFKSCLPQFSVNTWGIHRRWTFFIIYESCKRFKIVVWEMPRTSVSE